MKSWLTLSGIKQGPIFCNVNKASRVGNNRLSDKGISRIVFGRATSAGLVGTAENPISSHSLRAGFITSAYKAGVSDIEIMHHVRHKNPQVMRGYVRRQQLDNVNPAVKIGL